MFYRNRNDPRTFIYVHEKCRWLGVELNYARPLSWLITLLTVPAWFLLLAAVIIGMPATVGPGMWIVVGILLTYRLLWVLAFAIGAKRDLARNPGAAAERPEK